MDVRIRIKRVYEPPEPGDGERVLVDRLWPRGVSRVRARLDTWNKALAPSTELRRWFDHEPGRFEEFRRRYIAELYAQAPPRPHLASIPSVPVDAANHSNRLNEPPEREGTMPRNLELCDESIAPATHARNRGVSSSLPASPDRTQRYGAVLAMLGVVFAIQGIAPPSAWVQILASVLLGAVLLLALRETKARSRFVTVAAVIVIAVVTVSVVAAAKGQVDGPATRLTDALVVALAPVVIAVGLVRDLRARRRVTVETVFGVLSIYLLVGMFFANLYVAANRLGTPPFFAGGQAANVPHCMYFSFTTLTTVGYGDFTARTSFGHTLAVSEGLVGQIYLVTVVSLIVSNLGRRRRTAPG